MSNDSDHISSQREFILQCLDAVVTRRVFAEDAGGQTKQDGMSEGMLFVHKCRDDVRELLDSPASPLPRDLQDLYTKSPVGTLRQELLTTRAMLVRSEISKQVALLRARSGLPDLPVASSVVPAYEWLCGHLPEAMRRRTTRARCTVRPVLGYATEVPRTAAALDCDQLIADHCSGGEPGLRFIRCLQTDPLLRTTLETFAIAARQVMEVERDKLLARKGLGDVRVLLDDVVALLITECLDECRELISIEAMFVGSWLIKARGDACQPKDAEVQGVQFELMLFNVAILFHLVFDLSPLTDEMRATLADRLLLRFENWAFRAFPNYFESVQVDPRRQLELRRADYDRMTVRSAIADAVPEAQMRLCQKLFANTNSRSQENARTFQICVFCQSFPRVFVKLLDRIYQTLGPNSVFRDLYLIDAERHQAANASQPRILIDNPSGNSSASPAAAYLAPRLAVYYLRCLFVSAVFLVTATCCSLAALNLVCAFPGLVAAASCLLAMLPGVWLLAWAHRQLLAARGALRVLRTNQYSLYLRASNVDKYPPFVGFEAALASAFFDLAPLLAVHYPFEWHPSGAVRISVGEAWQAPVIDLMRGAELCVFVVSPRRGYDQGFGRIDEAWKEIESLTKLSRPGHALFMFPRKSGDYPLLLLHPKGDRTYGVSTMLHEVRRFVDAGLGEALPDRMGANEWLWWAPDGRFVAIPPKATGWPSPLSRQIESAIAPVLASFRVGPKSRRPTLALALIGAVAGGSLLAVAAESVQTVASSPFVLASLAIAALSVVWDYWRERKKCSHWFVYDNTIRPRDVHAYGLEGVYPGRTHPKLPH